MDSIVLQMNVPYRFTSGTYRAVLILTEDDNYSYKGQAVDKNGWELVEYFSLERSTTLGTYTEITMDEWALAVMKGMYV